MISRLIAIPLPFDRFDASKMTVLILEHDRNTTAEAKTQEFKVEKTIKHSGYSTLNYNNDIALVKLKKDIAFRGSLRPVCLPERGNQRFPIEIAVI